MQYVMEDMYDALPPERGVELRRRNNERIAQLEAEGRERQTRLTLVAAVPADQAPRPA